MKATSNSSITILSPVRNGSLATKLYLSLTAALAAISSLNAQDSFWIGDGAGTSWNDSGNWDSGVVPGVTSGATNGDTASFNVGAATNLTVNVDAGRLIYNVEFDNAVEPYEFVGETLRVASGGTFSMAPGNAVGDGGDVNFNVPILIEPSDGVSDVSFTINEGAGRNYGMNFNGGISSGVTTGSAVVEMTGPSRFSSEINGVISDGGAAGGLSLLLSQSGQLTLAGVNTFTGGTTFAATSSDVVIGNDSAFGTGAVTVNSGSLVEFRGPYDATLANDFIWNGTVANIGPTHTYTGSIQLGTVADAIPVVSSNGKTTIFEGVISDGGFNKALVVTGGQVVFDAVNTFTGGVDFESDKLVLENEQGLGTGTLRLFGGHADVDEEQTLYPVLSNLDLDVESERNVANDIILDADLVLDSSGNRWGGWNFSGNVSVGSVGSELMVDASGVSLSFDGVGSTYDPEGTAGVRFTGVLEDGGHDTALAKRGAGRIILSNDNLLTGTVTVEDGSLQIGDGGSSGQIGSANVVLQDSISDTDPELLFNRSDSYTVANTISGAGGVEFSGTGTATTTADSTYAGMTTITGGASLLVDGSHTGGMDYVVADGSAFGGSGSVDVGTATIQLLAGSSLTPGSENAAGTLTLLGTGALDLSEVANTGTGALVFRLGTESDTVLMELGTLFLAGSALQFSDFTFETIAGFGAGNYTLFDAGLIIGSLGDATGLINGMEAMISIEGSQINLSVVPEPGMAALFLGFLSLGLVAVRRRKL